ncbi:RICIN domain-containing protein [Hymenobacter weizhouensis]|uniref:RICIN domain-containing protein n=1 Tax=Hymenobacter sp. YIM 151500-1 TaxID=2987689 RepID=UPI002226B389|nr:RICIN domain-containing protein [Hymenobacter sp. YIM 151500-1]UYZ63635.1 RICIN domain-containing protein [Hymenobacter sp. YIM 151500-1]
MTRYFCLLCLLLLWPLAWAAQAQPAPRDLQGNILTLKDTNYPVPGSGAYFVSPQGSDQNPGTLAQPWRSFTHALTAAPSGATIVFRAGTYRPSPTQTDRSRMGAVNKRLTLQPYPHEQVWVKGSEEVTGWVADGTAWRHNNWPYSFGKNAGDENLEPGYPQAFLRDMVFVDGRALAQVTRRQDVTAGTFYVDPAGRAIYLGDNPAGKTVESAAMERALWMGWGYTEAAGTVVRGLGFAHFTELAMEFAAPNIVLENNTFVWNASIGAQLLGSAPGSNSRAGTALNCIVRGNTFSYNGRKGFDASMAHGLLLEDNTFTYNNIERFNGGWDAAGLKITGLDDMVFRRNRVENNYSMGLWMDIGVRRAQILHNTVLRNGIIGIFFEISDGALIAGNLCVGNGESGIQISNSANARIYHNTLVDNGRALVINETERPGAGKTEEYSGQGILLPNWVTQGNVAKNNILANGGTVRNLPSWQVQDVLDVFNWPLNPADPPMVTALDYNLYYRTSATQPTALARWTEARTGDNRELPGLAALRQRVGVEANGRSLDNQPLTALFLDPAAGNYQLSPSSPARGAGQALPQEVAQALGVPTGVAVDIGAYPQAAAPVADGVYTLTARHSGKRLDVYGAGRGDTVRVIQWEATGGQNQQWRVQHMGQGYYQLTAVHSGRALDVAGSNPNDGAKVQQYTANNTDAQRWKLETTADGFYRLINKASGKCLDVAGGANATANGVRVQQWTYYGNLNQQWQLQAVAGSPVTSAASAATAPAATLSVFPNPSPDGQATLRLTAQQAQRATVQVYNQQGQFVSLLTVPLREGQTEFRLPAMLPPGTYYLKTRLDGQARQFTLKVE